MLVGRAARAVGISNTSRLYRSAVRIYDERIGVPGRRSYSQFGEDLALARMLPMSKGFYIDIGAGEPIIGSNSYALYKRGWRGILVELLPDLARRLKRRRGGDTVVEAACGASSEPIVLHRFDQYQLSTVDATVAARLSMTGMIPVEQLTIPTVRLMDIAPKTSPWDPSVLLIDVEGHELSVLEGNDWSRYLPRVVCIEQWASPLQEEPDTHRFLQSVGYSLVEFMGMSGIYLHEDAQAGA